MHMYGVRSSEVHDPWPTCTYRYSSVSEATELQVLRIPPGGDRLRRLGVRRVGQLAEHGVTEARVAGEHLAEGGGLLGVQLHHQVRE